ncbi:DUF3857 domain-containing protein [Bacteroidales bacterium OttesenSCG-928-I14]|nr:DUF3857 domain-containing protein [Bacteroidales bacterium OttesenSCG-928-I14]
MKNIFPILVLFLCIHTITAQEKIKFGDCPQDLLEMTSYKEDPDATAVVLYEKATSYYRVSRSPDGFFDVVMEYVVRIKILSQDAVDEYANVYIPFYKGKTRSQEESISGLTGWTYNLEGNKVIKTKLSKDYIFTEDISNTYKRMKFALPNVKAGSVIEYKFTKTSPYYWELDTYRFQRDIPVKYSFFQITIPEYFTFNIEEKGYENLNRKQEKVNQSFTIGGQILTCTAEEIQIEAKNIPAMKAEDYVWNPGEYISHINFELQSFQIPGVVYQNYSKTWNNIVQTLNESDNFGKQFNNKNLFKDELPSILAGQTNATDSIRSVLNMVRSKVKWDKTGSIGINNQEKALKEGVGSSGEMNALLINALKNAGYNTFPVVMSLRSRGRIPFTHPSIERLNYFIVCVFIDSKIYYLDATQAYTDLNVIPLDCMVERAMIIYPNNRFDWVNLTKIGNNIQRTNLIYKFNDEGIMEGQISQNNMGELAYTFKSRYDRASDQDEYIEKIEEQNRIKITDYSMEEKDQPSFGFLESYTFTYPDFHLEDKVISFNPLMFLALKSNSFKAETRKFPIEFDFPYTQRINASFTIPKGYIIDELPSSEKVIYDDELINFSYIIQQTGNTIQLAYQLKLNTVIISALDYDSFRDFWSKMYNKEREMITIVKQDI